MRRLFLICLAATLLHLGLSSSTSAISQATELYREAVMKDTGERDPEAALQLYQQVIEESSDDHRLVAKARLRMGNCYERLGKSKEAEEIYLEIIKDSSESLAEAVQAAQANLEKLQAQERKAQEQIARLKPMVLVHEFHETRFSLSVGPGWERSGTDSLTDLALALRYRISPSSRSLRLFGEVGASLPLGNAQFSNQNIPSDSQTTDIASLKLNYQTHLALIAEIPHGHQTLAVPEVGAGAALTSSEVQYTSGSSGSQSHSAWSPYLTAGMHFLPERRVSLLLQGTYTANPYSTSVQIPVPAHTQSFDFPTSLWSVSAIVQVKIGWTKTVLRAKE